MSDASPKVPPGGTAPNAEAEAATATAQSWSLMLPPGTPPEQQRAAVLRVLTDRIREMMVRDPEKLFQTLYRLDVDEERVHHLLNKRDKSDVPAQLAELVLKREYQKFLSRRSSS